MLGDYTTYGSGDALDAFPELRDLDMTEQMTYELGDISVHTHLTIHGAGPNLMDRPRWGYLLVDPAGRHLLERVTVPELRYDRP